MPEEKSAYNLPEQKVPFAERVRSVFRKERNRALVEHIAAGRAKDALDLIAKSADVSLPVNVSREWESPLEAALNAPEINLDIVKALLRRGSEITPDILYRCCTRFQDFYTWQAASPVQTEMFPVDGEPREQAVAKKWQETKALFQMFSRAGANWQTVVDSNHTAIEFIRESIHPKDSAILPELGIPDSFSSSKPLRLRPR